MLVVNPDDAHESAVGPVFDAATWVTPKVYSSGVLMPLALSLGCVAATCVLLRPELLGPVGTDFCGSLREAIEEGQREHPWWMRGGALLAAGLSYLFFAMSVADLTLRGQGTFFLRAGPGGLSLRMPAGMKMLLPCYRVLRLDASWRDIADWTIVQHKIPGSLSANAGNVHADLELKLRDGERHTIPLTWFREPARIIWIKIQDAIEMVPMEFVPEGLADEDQLARH